MADFESRLDVATPERVAFALPIAGVGHRAIAYLVDAGLMLLAWVTLYFALSFILDLRALASTLSKLALTLLVLGIFACQWVYWIAWEVLGNGQTPGKRVARIRVVREDGMPVGVFESAARNLCRAIDFLPGFYGLGLATLMLTERSRRLGDLVGGTLLIKVESVSLSKYFLSPRSSEPPLTSWQHAPTLSAEEAELVLSFLERVPTLEAAARHRLAQLFLERLSGRAVKEGEVAEDVLRQWVRAGPAS